jgi:hypothetical protein
LDSIFKDATPPESDQLFAWQGVTTATASVIAAIVASEHSVFRHELRIITPRSHRLAQTLTFTLARIEHRITVWVTAFISRSEQVTQ